MRSRINHSILFLLLYQLIGQHASAQDYLPKDPVESIRLFTDRSLYITGEFICFSATLLLEDEQFPPNPHMIRNPSHQASSSRVLYLEIIDPKGRQVLGNKFPVMDYRSLGRIRIPEELSTGIYYLRGYTKSMRNKGPDSYACNQVKIVNPFRKDMPEEGTEIPGQESRFLPEPPHSRLRIFTMKTDRKKYGQLDTVQLMLRRTDFPDSLVSACLSVVPAGSCNYRILVSQKAGGAVIPLHFNPEYHGITVSGVVRDKGSGRPLPSRVLDLTILGDNGDFVSTYTDSSGRFSFPLPELTGQRNLFIGIQESDSSMPLILIDNDYCAEAFNLPVQSFQLEDEERSAALKLSRNYQVTRGFATVAPATVTGEENCFSGPFYGTPTLTLNLDEYIPLPTLEDYFNELPYLVKVRRTNGRKYLKILGPSPELRIFQPLVLLDMVAVYDISKLLAISSSDISHIDVINEPYIKGIMTYGGIVSIVSKNRDFAGFDLPAAGIFIDYEFLSPEGVCNPVPGDPGSPDSRNTLYWEGDLGIWDDRSQLIPFLTGNSRGDYTIVIRGVLHNGNTYVQKLNFRVE